MKAKNMMQLKDLLKSKKNRLILLIGAVGVVLLFLSEMVNWLPPSSDSSGGSADTVSLSEWEEDMRSQLTELVCAIDGAGKSMVMLTLASDGEASYAADIRSESAVGERTTESSYEKTYLIIDGANGETGLIQKTTAPEIRGVAVVCEGGGSAAVKREITETISAALGIGREKIYVAKMSTTE